jgi:O-methyltransferase
MIKIYLHILSSAFRKIIQLYSFHKIHNRFSTYTMISSMQYADNLALCKTIIPLKGDIVECGVWRGGMIAGISFLLGNNRHYYLFDSFEGLPKVSEKDGAEAKAWQNDSSSSSYYDNCSAEQDFAKKAMSLANTKNYSLIKGWFNETLPLFNKTDAIALLRLDGDWYESTMICLKHLFPKVVTGGIIIIDDYYTWEGCTKAVHDYLSEHQRTEKIQQSSNGVCYIIKNK